ncbi:MAG: hypothetical protein ACE5HA_17010 [Anaerolineae bacterium]
MRTLVLVGRSIGAACAGGVSALAGFGLLLASAWLPTFSTNTTYRTATTLLAAVVGFFIGGYIAGLLAGRRQALHGGLFGLALGLFAFAYVLGPAWYVLIAALTSGLLGALGGWSVRRWTWA